ncbi:alpha/beta hydrolase [Streptomyces phaeofaciens JCM 4814]|uniref:Hydrolase n=1 Tax=Streptomyces phaeofaciens TaxID=68254 RepID=A0A918HSN8_9ACTN|nr:alpha/beta hydrolase [Streptomyces phaeofaciens]GGT97585.1 hydrolase [Streptomyces phaeofaciens]
MNQEFLATPHSVRFTRYGLPGRGTLAFVHGFLDNSLVWHEVIVQMRSQDWQIIAVDLQGTGRSSISSAETLQSYADQTLAAIASVTTNPEAPLVVVGHSMGGAVAELVALHEPAGLAGLVLITPAVLSGYPLSEKQTAALRATALDRDPQAARTARTTMSTTLRPESLQVLIDAHLGTPAATALEQLAAWTGGHPEGERASSVRVPTLIMASDDTFFTYDLIRDGVVNRFHNAEMTRVSDAGHWPHVEQPAVVAAALDAFLAQNCC